MLQTRMSAMIDHASGQMPISLRYQTTPHVAVLIPCYNEAVSIAKVIGDFHTALPEAVVYVYDNNSSDRTSLAARSAGAIVRNEELQGKGHVVRRMFADVDAEIYVLVDGDDTYDAAIAPHLIWLLITNQLDMVSAARVSASSDAYRPGHRVGNKVLSGLVQWVFGSRITDVLSGYRVFSRRFVKSFPALSVGFETEIEFTVHALELQMPIGEAHTAYRGRAAGSLSKLRTWHDGVCILCTILLLVKEQRPLQFFTLSGLMLLGLAIAIGSPAIAHLLAGGFVLHTPSTVLATGLVVLASLTFGCGLLLASVARGRKEIKRLAYLAVPALHTVL